MENHDPIVLKVAELKFWLHSQVIEAENEC